MHSVSIFKSSSFFWPASLVLLHHALGSVIVYFVPVTLDEGISSAVVPSAGLLDVLENEKYCDVTFIVEGERFKAHRVILASQCEYFDRY